MFNLKDIISSIADVGQKLFKKSEIKKMIKIIKDEMISVASSDFHSFSIPLTVDINSGDNWGMLH